VEEYLGIDVHMKVIALKFKIIFVWLDPPMLSSTIYYKIWKFKFKIPSKFEYQQNKNLFCIRFVGIDLKCNTLNVAGFEILLYKSMTSFW
jgi:hypothetical protein